MRYYDGTFRQEASWLYGRRFHGKVLSPCSQIGPLGCGRDRTPQLGNDVYKAVLELNRRDLWISGIRIRNSRGGLAF